jgi:hypothetical protein
MIHVVHHKVAVPSPVMQIQLLLASIAHISTLVDTILIIFIHGVVLLNGGTSSSSIFN